MTTAKAGVCDVELVTAAANGDVRAWDALVDRVLPQVWSAALDAGLDDAGARDVCNLIFLRVAQRLHEFSDATEAVEWSRRIAVDECRRVRAKRCGTASQLRKRRPSTPSVLALPGTGCVSAACDGR